MPWSRAPRPARDHFQQRRRAWYERSVLKNLRDNPSYCDRLLTHSKSKSRAPPHVQARWLKLGSRECIEVLRRLHFRARYVRARTSQSPRPVAHRVARFRPSRLTPPADVRPTTKQGALDTLRSHTLLPPHPNTLLLHGPPHHLRRQGRLGTRCARNFSHPDSLDPQRTTRDPESCTSDALPPRPLTLPTSPLTPPPTHPPPPTPGR